MDIEQLKVFKINVAERSGVKQIRIPSFHEVLGPILTGFYYSFHAKLISLPHLNISESTFWAFTGDWYI